MTDPSTGTTGGQPLARPLNAALGARAGARCWWPHGHFWSLPNRQLLCECLWCGKAVPSERLAKQKKDK